MTEQLWHYTCDHGREAIGEHGTLRPNRHAVQAHIAPCALIWATDLDTPNPAPLGLTSHLSRCDRTAHRYRIDQPHLMIPWLRSGARTLFTHQALRQLEDPELGRRPDRWWISPRPITATHEPNGPRT